MGEFVANANTPLILDQLPEFGLSRVEIIAVDGTSLLGGLSECEPPDPIPNSEVKPFSADDSVGSPTRK